MKVLVTGGAGFIGSHIVDAYVRNGYDVYIVDNLFTGKRENINQGAKFYEFDVREPKTAELIKDVKFEIICHHAAQMDVRKSVEDPKFDADVNIMGLLNIMQSAITAGTKKIIFSSSGGTIYGECGALPPSEDARPNPMSPYGISKLVSEYYLKYYSQIYGIKHTILRYANVYGPRQDPHGEAGVVAIFFNKMIKNEDVIIYGDGKQMRDYVFVEDVVGANLSSIHKGDNCVINIGTGIPVSVNELYDVIKRSGNYNSGFINKPSRAGELFKSFLNYNFAEKILGWQPKYKLDAGIKKTMEYFKARAGR